MNVKLILSFGAVAVVGNTLVGQVSTPYTKAPSAEEVARQRQRTDQSRVVFDYAPGPTAIPITVWESAITYCAGTPNPVAATFIAGADDNGNGQKLRLGDVFRFEIAGIDKDMAVLKITALPAITEQELLQSAPSYSALRKRFRELRLRVPLQGGGGRLCLSGKKRISSERPDVFSVLDTKAVGSTIDLSYDGNQIWWAVPSVVADPRYPYIVGGHPIDVLGKPKEPQ
jgi:hypothetical protein